jgi:tetratricopeptide (TPR) repeat protein
MASDNERALIGQAWSLHRSGQYREAIDIFEGVIRSSADNVDAHYGLGLAQRAAGSTEAARASFQYALDLSQQRLNHLRDGRDTTNNNLQTIDDDRYMMLVRMLKQRIAETH